MSAAARLESLASLGLRPLRRHLGGGITRLLALRIVRTAERRSPSLFKTAPPPGYRRGIDHYTRQELIASLQKVLLTYRRACGRFPDLVTPRLFSEKVNHAKFFSPIKVPETGNKLLTASFLPPGLEGCVRMPAIVWHDDRPRLPENDRLAPGDYFLKASHGSDMVRRIRFPLTAAEREELEATGRRWLSQPFGLDQGEWWYNVFPRRLLIERSVTACSPSASLLFYVLNGEVAMITVFVKPLRPGTPSRRLLLDPAFRPYAVQDPPGRRLEDFSLSEELQGRCLEVARSIGRPFLAVRVDLIVGDDDGIYLNELTFSPNAGIPFVDRELDRHLGDLWPGPGHFTA